MTSLRKRIDLMSPREIEYELLKSCIAERFDGDVAWLDRLYDEDRSDAKYEELRNWLARANRLHHSYLD